MPLYEVPTRTVTNSGTGSYQRQTVLQGKWQEHTETINVTAPIQQYSGRIVYWATNGNSSIGTYTFSYNCDDVGACLIKVSFSTGNPSYTTSYDVNSNGTITVRVNVNTSYDGTATVSGTVRGTNRETSTYWDASTSYTLTNSGANITSVSFVTGTQPTLSYSGRTVTANWSTSTAPTGTVAGATVTIYYTAPYSYSYTYADVYFNGTRVDYIYLDGTRWPN